jgi:hypothetical protein
MWAPDAQAGVQFAAVKFLQRVILVQSRGIADPRVSGILFFWRARCRPTMSCYPFPSKLQNRNDPNLSIVPGDHPFINAATLETEGVALLQRLITDLYTKQYVGSVGIYIAHASPFQKPGPYIRYPKQLVKSRQTATWIRPDCRIFPDIMDSCPSHGPSLHYYQECRKICSHSFDTHIPVRASVKDVYVRCSSSDPFFVVHKLAQILHVRLMRLSQSSPNAWNKLQQTRERVGPWQPRLR